MKDVARKVIGHVRFSLLDPEYLNLVEKENELKPFIPVSIRYLVVQSRDIMITFINPCLMVEFLHRFDYCRKPGDLMPSKIEIPTTPNSGPVQGPSRTMPLLANSPDHKVKDATARIKTLQFAPIVSDELLDVLGRPSKISADSSFSLHGLYHAMLQVLFYFPLRLRCSSRRKLSHAYILIVILLLGQNKRYELFMVLYSIFNFSKIKKTLKTSLKM